MEKDPNETENLVEEKKKIAEEMKTKILEHLSREEKISAERKKLLTKIKKIREEGL